MLHKNLVTKYKAELENYFIKTSFNDVGMIEQNGHKWFNVKSLQCISSMAQLYVETKNSILLEKLRFLFLYILGKQHSDGYYDSEVYSKDHKQMRANVIFINIELFNTFELIEKGLTLEERNNFF